MNIERPVDMNAAWLLIEYIENAGSHVEYASGGIDVDGVQYHYVLSVNGNDTYGNDMIDVIYNAYINWIEIQNSI